ncbi:hypothetical protein JST97_05955 [bacterium]|nr:hypothetical protein [bacterium]
MYIQGTPTFAFAPIRPAKGPMAPAAPTPPSGEQEQIAPSLNENLGLMPKSLTFAPSAPAPQAAPQTQAAPVPQEVPTAHTARPEAMDLALAGTNLLQAKSGGVLVDFGSEAPQAAPSAPEPKPFWLQDPAVQAVLSAPPEPPTSKVAKSLMTLGISESEAKSLHQAACPPGFLAGCAGRTQSGVFFLVSKRDPAPGQNAGPEDYKIFLGKPGDIKEMPVAAIDSPGRSTTHLRTATGTKIDPYRGEIQVAGERPFTLSAPKSMVKLWQLNDGIETPQQSVFR